METKEYKAVPYNGKLVFISEDGPLTDGDICYHQDQTKGGVVDHKIEVNKGGHATDPNNLQTLCKSCHGRKTKQSYQP